MDTTAERRNRGQDTARLLRNAPNLSLAQAADENLMVRAARKALLAAAARRGRCAAAAAAAAADSNRPLNQREAAAAHRVMPPSALRVLGSARVAAQGSGPAAWPARTDRFARAAEPSAKLTAGVPAAPLRRVVSEPWYLHHSRLSSVAASAACPPLVLASLLAGHGYVAVAHAAAAHPACPAYALARLADHPDAAVAGCVIANNCPPAAMAASRHWAVKTAVAETTTSAVLLARLGGDSDPKVLEAVACNSACPPDVLERLSRAAHTEVRSAVAERSDTVPLILQRLAADPYWSVSYKAINNPALGIAALVALGTHQNHDVRAEAVACDRYPADALTALSSHPDPLVRATAASSPKSSSNSLAALASDPLHEI